MIDLRPAPHLYLPVVIAAGLLTLLGSSLTDDNGDTPPVAVTVNYTLQSSGPLSRELETRTGEVSALSLSGSYKANSGDGLTLDRTPVNLDQGGSYVVSVTPTGTDELLTGSATIELTAPLDLRVNGNPTSGQFSSLYDGSMTTTIVDASSSGVDVSVGAAAAMSYTWAEFVALEDDTDAGLDERMTSAAYNMLIVVLRSALIAEGIAFDIENNQTDLEGVNTGTALVLTCDNGANDGTGEVGLFWTDAVGTGQGVVGDDDSFEARYENCERSGLNRFLDGATFLSDYTPDRGTGLRTLAGDLLFSEVFVAEEMLGSFDNPSATKQRYNGTLEIRYVEVESL